MIEDDPFRDLTKLRLNQAVEMRMLPEKVRRRREQFIMVPMWWYERLANPLPVTRCTVALALYVLHLHWKNYGKPFRLANAC